MSTQYRAMGLSECAAFDHGNGARERLTGWGKVCKDREARGVSRKQRRIRRAAEEAKRKAAEKAAEEAAATA